MLIMVFVLYGINIIISDVYVNIVNKNALIFWVKRQFILFKMLCSSKKNFCLYLKK